MIFSSFFQDFLFFFGFLQFENDIPSYRMFTICPARYFMRFLDVCLVFCHLKESLSSYYLKYFAHLLCMFTCRNCPIFLGCSVLFLFHSFFSLHLRLGNLHCLIFKLTDSFLNCVNLLMCPSKAFFNFVTVFLIYIISF